MKKVMEKLTKNCVEDGDSVDQKNSVVVDMCETSWLYTIIAQVFHPGSYLLIEGFPRNPHRTITTNI